METKGIGSERAGMWDDFWKKTDEDRSWLHRAIVLARGYFDGVYSEHAMALLGDMDGKKVLDAGCGTGLSSLRLAKEGAAITGIDISKNSVALATKIYAQHRIPRANGRFFVGDITHMPFKGNSFDLVWSQGVVEHFRKPEIVVREMARVARRGGFVLILVPYTYSFYQIIHKIAEKFGVWPYGYECSFSGKGLRELMASCGFADIRTGVVWSTFGITVSVSGKKIR